MLFRKLMSHIPEQSCDLSELLTLMTTILKLPIVTTHKVSIGVIVTTHKVSINAIVMCLPMLLVPQTVDYCYYKMSLTRGFQSQALASLISNCLGVPMCFHNAGQLLSHNLILMSYLLFFC